MSAASTVGVVALREFAKLTNTNFSVLITVIGTTFLTVLLFGWYAKKKLPTGDDFEKREPLKDIHLGWYAGLFAMELYGFCDQLTASKTNFDGGDAFLGSSRVQRRVQCHCVFHLLRSFESCGCRQRKSLRPLQESFYGACDFIVRAVACVR